MAGKNKKFPSTRNGGNSNAIGLDKGSGDETTIVEILPNPEPEFLKGLPKHKKVKVGIQRLNVRVGPSLNARILDVAKQDDIFEVTNSHMEWYSVKIDPSLGQSVGYLLAKFVEEVDQDDE